MLENAQPPKDFTSETAQKEILSSVDILLPELDRKLVETGLRVLAQYYLNKEHPFPQGLVFAETSAPPFQYAVIPVMERLAKVRGAAIPQSYPIVLQGLWNWSTQDQRAFTDLMRQNANAVMLEIQKHAAASVLNILLVDDYTATGSTIKAGKEAFSGLAMVQPFTFLAAKRIIAGPPVGLLIGAEDPYDDTGTSHGFTFRRSTFKNQRKIITGVERKVRNTMRTEKIKPEEDNPALRSEFQTRIRELGERVAAGIH